MSRCVHYVLHACHKAETTNTSGVTDFADWKYMMVLCARNLRGSIQDFFSGNLDDLRIYNYVLTDMNHTLCNSCVEGIR